MRIRLLLLLSAFFSPTAIAQDQPEYVSGVIVVQFAPEVAYKAGIRTGLQEFDTKATLYQIHSIERVYPFLDHVEPTP
ncbi:MAG: hypothetical protein OXF48_07430, partial [Bacteroidetes bacterium]|nr:hypothetical protein [Bacteroidota bacterium]